ncbi:MAG TPA: hypothetical protein VGL77_13580 [Armatimonadota bacterium]
MHHAFKGKTRHDPAGGVNHQPVGRIGAFTLPDAADAGDLLFMLATMTFPVAVSIMLGYRLMRDLHMLNTYKEGFFDSLPRELYAAAALVGAMYVSPDEQVAVMQMVDEHGAGQNVGRPHCNPNQPVITANGTPLIVDGHPVSHEVFRFPGCQQTVTRLGRTEELDWSEGALGAHSCVLIDNEEGYVPSRKAHGAVTAWAELQETALLATESAICYQPAYDVTRVQRTSAILAGGRAIILRDDISAESVHQYTSRFYLRPCTHTWTTAEGWPALTVFTPERVRFHLIALDAGAVAQRQLVGFPTVLEGRAAVVDVQHAAPGTRSTLTMLVCPDPEIEAVADVTADWQVWGGASADAQHPRHITASLDRDMTMEAAVAADRVVTLHQTMQIPPEWAAREVCLRLPSGLRTSPVCVNGARVDTPLPSEFHPEGDVTGDFQIKNDLLHPWVTLKRADAVWSGPCEVVVRFERVPGSDHLYFEQIADSRCLPGLVSAHHAPDIRHDCARSLGTALHPEHRPI